MASTTTVEVVDDLDGTPAAGTIEFSYRGKTYEIDLSVENTGDFDDVMARYLAAGRRVTRGVAGKQGRTLARRRQSADVRQWAREQGMEIPDRGRIPARIVEQYEAAH